MNCRAFSPLLLFTLAYVQFARGSPYPVVCLAVTQLNASSSLSDYLRLEMTKDKCVGGEAAFNNLKVEIEKSRKCIKGLENVTRGESEEMSSQKNLDAALRKFCEKLPEGKGCFSNLFTAGERCLGESEKPSLSVSKNMFDGFLNFMCLEKGDFLPKFYKGEGYGCMKEKCGAINACGTSAAQKYPHPNNPNKEIDWFKMNPSDEDCRAMHDVEECIVNELKGCGTQTAANVFGTLIKMINEKTPCKKERSQLA